MASRLGVSACLALSFASFALVLTASTAEAKPHPRAISVDRVVFPVTLSDQATYDLVAYRYHRAGGHGPLQLLVHGASYDHRYWDAGSLGGEDYSYARYMVERGYDVVALDLLGAGESDKPFGFFLNLNESASSLSQVIAQLRAKHNPTGKKYHRVALVGHSNGTVTAIREEATYHLADALVTTGWGHTFAPVPIDFGPIFVALQQPYLQPDAFPLPLRTFLFFHLPETDPAMPAYDAGTLATTMASGQFFDTLMTSLNPPSDGVGAVTGPVLVQLGDHDVLAPGELASIEAGYWTSASSVTVQELGEMGHDVNLHLNREQSWTAIDAWLRDTFDDGEDD